MSSHLRNALEVKEHAATTNDTCGKAAAVNVGPIKTSLSGTTLGSKNEYGENIKCDGYSACDGPQVYYRLTWKPGQTYKLTLTPSFSSRFYLFGAKCDAKVISADRSSKGLTGAYASVFGSSSSPSGSIYLRPTGTINHLAIDSSGPTYQGTYKVDIEPFTPSANGTCAKAKVLTLSGGKVSVSGDTTGVPNEFGTSINCGNYKSIPYGGQLYYRITLSGGKTYKVSLTPAFSSGKLYIFSGACTAAAINKDCASKGQTGDVSKTIFKGQTGTISLTPASKSVTYTIVVDATSDSSYSYGSFSLDIQ